MYVGMSATLLHVINNTSKHNTICNTNVITILLYAINKLQLIVTQYAICWYEYNIASYNQQYICRNHVLNEYFVQYNMLSVFILFE
jgi:hypothetical protein